MVKAFPDLTNYRQATIDETAAAENFIEMEHIELPPMDYSDPMNEEVVDDREKHIDTESLSSHDDLPFDQVSVILKHANSIIKVEDLKIQIYQVDHTSI